MFVIDVVGFEPLSISEIQSTQLRVSEAHVVVIVDHNSAKDTLVVFVREVVGFDWFVIAISVNF